MEIKEIESIIEGILFASGAPVETQRIARALEMDEGTVLSVVRHMCDTYNFNRAGLKIVELDGKFQLCTRPEYSEYIKRALDNRREYTLSAASLEVLAIIAYNQPVTRAMIEQIRGVDSSGVVNTLLDKGFIEDAGSLEIPGRPRLYATTSDFLLCFGISSVSELPPLEAGLAEYAQERLAGMGPEVSGEPEPEYSEAADDDGADDAEDRPPPVAVLPGQETFDVVLATPAAVSAGREGDGMEADGDA